MITNIRDGVQLNNGLAMPWLGLGVFKMTDGREVTDAVKHALQVGYRSIDTAAAYRNESGVGQALRESGVPREDIFLTTKLWNEEQRKGRTLEAFKESLERLGTDYVDLYLVHWPVPGRYKETWKAMEEIYASGQAKAIGVSNFMVDHLEDLLSDSKVVPAVNQVEFHPFLIQPELLRYCRDHGIQVEAWSPLMQAQIVNDPVVRELADELGKTPAQVVLRWDLQHEVVTIPKSTHAGRIEENAGIFDFELSAEEMKRLDALDAGRRVGPDPHNFDF